MNPETVSRNGAQGVVSRPFQKRFLTIPKAPVCYWLRERFFKLLAGKTLGHVADVCQGLVTANDPRFVRFVWETPTAEWALSDHKIRWVPFEKGGGYGKWHGHHFWVVDWELNGARIKSTPNPRVQNEKNFFREGHTYSYMARGCLGVRKICLRAITCDLSAGIFEKKRQQALSSILNSRISSYIVHSLSAKIQLRESYVGRIPFPCHVHSSLETVEGMCVALKRKIVSNDLAEIEHAISQYSVEKVVTETQAVLCAVEGISENLVFNSYDLGTDDVDTIVNEVGIPAGWFPLIQGYDSLPPLPDGLPKLPPEIIDFLSRHERQPFDPEAMNGLKRRLRALFEPGNGFDQGRRPGYVVGAAAGVHR